MYYAVYVLSHISHLNDNLYSVFKVTMVTSPWCSGPHLWKSPTVTHSVVCDRHVWSSIQRLGQKLRWPHEGKCLCFITLPLDDPSTTRTGTRALNPISKEIHPSVISILLWSLKQHELDRHRHTADAGREIVTCIDNLDTSYFCWEERFRQYLVAVMAASR